MPSRQAVIGFDGTAASERAVRAAGELLTPRPVLIVVAVEEGEAFASLIAPLGAAGLPATELEIRNALRAEAEIVQQAVRTTQKGVALAEEVGLEAEGLTVCRRRPGRGAAAPGGRGAARAGDRARRAPARGPQRAAGREYRAGPAQAEPAAGAGGARA